MEQEDFDMKLKKANNEIFPAFPPFEKEAWDKMESLLDKHLPQKKKKRRYLLWWFTALIPLVLITGYYLTYHPTIETKQAALQNSSVKKVNNKPSSIQQSDTQQKLNDIVQNKNDVSTFNNLKKEAEIKEMPNVELNTKDNQKKSFTKSLNHISYIKNGILKKVKNNNELSSKNSQNQDNISSSYPNVGLAQKEKEMEPIETNRSLLPAPTSSMANKEKDSIKINFKPVVKTSTSKNNFYFTLTSGFESNGTSPGNLGVFTPLYGGGLQYKGGKKMFFRAGFLVIKKKYAAADKDYNRKTGTWMSMVTFDNIDANCKVLEIPVSVGYKLNNNQNTGVYVTAGTSAYFLKKEDYQFYFKNPSGNDTTRGATFTNKHNHYFSSITLSAGLEQKVNNKFSLTAEPIIKIPFSGIGFGKVNLYSAGIFITAKLKLK